MSPQRASPSPNAPWAPPVLTPTRFEDRLWMARALEMAHLAACRSEVPVGAVVVRDGKLLAEAHNLTKRADKLQKTMV